MSEIINWIELHSKQLIFWVAILIFIGLILSSSLLFGLYNNLSQLNEGMKDNENKIETLEKSQASSQDRGPRGPAGVTGPPGPSGKAGGDYQSAGPLRNLQSAGAYVLDRLHGAGPASVAYLNKLSYQPNQIWTYLANNQIQNQYGQCLQGDETTGSVYMAGCDPNSTKQQWSHNNYGQLSSAESGGSQCLDVALESQFDGANKIVQGGQLEPGNSHYNLRIAKLKPCNQPKTLSSSQQWVFA